MGKREKINFRKAETCDNCNNCTEFYDAMCYYDNSSKPWTLNCHLDNTEPFQVTDKDICDEWKQKK